MQPVFEAAVDTELASAAGTPSSLQISTAQQIIEAYRQAEIQSVLGVDCVPPMEPIRPANLAAGELLLYPILLNDRVELLIAGAGQPFQRLKADRSTNRSEVAQLVGRMVNATSAAGGDDWREPARRLYKILIAPIENLLSPETTLIVVPDGPLRALPLAALLDNNGGFLIRRTRLDVAPALSYTHTGASMRGREPNVVAAALEEAVRLPAGFFPKLAGTGEEAHVAAEVAHHGKQGLVITNFRKADLARALIDRPVDILHLATHAAFNGRSDRSFIVAQGEVISLIDLRELIASARNGRDGLNLLVLSACETAVGDDQASMGLAGAAVQSGAISAIASLWEVNDQGTVELMRGFYTNYRAGQSKAEALRNAQLALLDQGGGLADPNIWAAFTLLGGWR
jgi:CHAT domain-containing protein